MYSAFYEILSFVRGCGSVQRVSIWNRFGVPDQPETEDSINTLVSRGWLRCKKGSSRYLDELTVTALGLEQLDMADKERRKSAKRQRDKESTESKRMKERTEDRSDAERRYRTQNKIAVIMPLVTFALGVLVEYFFRIIEFFFSWPHFVLTSLTLFLLPFRNSLDEGIMVAFDIRQHDGF